MPPSTARSSILDPARHSLNEAAAQLADYTCRPTGEAATDLIPEPLDPPEHLAVLGIRLPLNKFEHPYRMFHNRGIR
jgi:hypothetical protein